MFLNSYRRRLRSEALMRGIVFEERRLGDESGDAVPMTAGSSCRACRSPQSEADGWKSSSRSLRRGVACSPDGFASATGADR